MISRGTVFVLSNAHWHFSWQNIHEISVGIANRGYSVFFIEPLPLRWWPGWSRIFTFIKAWIVDKPELISGYKQNMHPRVEILWLTGVPDSLAFGKWINRFLFMPRAAKHLRNCDLPRPLIFVNNLPVSYSYALQEELHPDVTIYACTDSFADMPGFRHVNLIEHKIISSADLIFTTSQSLYDRYIGIHSRVVLMHPGVDYSLFERSRIEKMPGEPLLCVYFGTLRATDNDYDLLRKISHKFRLKIVGLIKEPIEGFSKTTQVVGAVDINKLPVHIADADVLLLPYIKAEHTRFITPAKIFQCLATGKPIVSIGLAGLEWLSDVIHACETHEEFMAAIEATNMESSELRPARLELAKSNSWEARIDELEIQIREILKTKGI